MPTVPRTYNRWDRQMLETYVPIAARHNVSPEQCLQLFHAMQRTWQQIASDATAAMAEGGGEDCYADEAEMMAEWTLDADRITYGCDDDAEREALGWVYRLPDGSWRMNVIKLGEDVWRAAYPG